MSQTAPPSPRRDRILLTGATGYIGGRLLPELESRGFAVRCLARHPEHLRDKVAAGTEVVRGDLLRPETLGPALTGVDTAYYLVHSMGSGGGFEQQELRAAQAFASAAKDAGVRRVVYLGGLGHSEQLSAHLRSRQRVGHVLRHGGVPTLEFRASVILGSGSLSFEMIRALVERLPVMVTPRWVATRAQPIAIEDVIAYLLAALALPGDRSRVFEIGGAGRASYGDIMREYARQRGLRRWMVPVPVLTPWLSGLWLGLVTPLQARVGRELMSSLPHETTVRDEAALRAFPAIRPRGLPEAIERARRNEDRDLAATRWSDAVSSLPPRPTFGGARLGSRLVDSRVVHVDAPPRAVFAALQRIGGERGWYHADALWRLRGALDELVGGPGLRRGRRDPRRLDVGDVVDCWRVEAIEPDALLRLRAEMRLPGRGWLQFEVEPDGDGARLRQTALFDPLGAAGLAYWYAIYPLHGYVFRGMLAGIARAARQAAGRRSRRGAASRAARANAWRDAG